MKTDKLTPRRYIWKLFLFRPGNVLLMMLLGIIIFNVTIQITGLLSRSVLNQLTGDSQVGLNPYTLCALFVAAGLFRSIAIFVGVPIYFSSTFSFGALIRKNLFKYILDQPGAKALPSSTGEAISRFRGDAEETAHFLMQLLFPVAGLTFTIVALIVMIRINVKIALTVFFPLMIIVIIVRLLQSYVEKFRKESREAAGSVTGFIGETFGAVEAVKVAVAEETLVDNFREINTARQKVAIRDSVFSTGLSSIFSNVVNIGTGLILILVAQSMKAGSFTVGDFALFVYYLGFMTQSIVDLSNLFIRIKQVGVSLQRLLELLKGTEPERLVEYSKVYIHGALPEIPYVPKTEEHTLHILKARNLSYHYNEGQNGIDAIDIRIKKGTLTVITGRIGSGKTTLLRVLLGLLPARTGELLWNGELVKSPETFLVPPRTSYTPQIPRLFSDTLRNNILMGLPESEVDLTKAVYLAALDRDIDDLDNGLDTFVGPRGVKLSGGQKQRAAAARMHVRNAELIVFDDLSSALDLNTEQIMWRRLFGQIDSTYLAVSHRPFVLERADNIVVLKNGGVDAQGTLHSLLESSAEMRDIYEQRK